MDFKTVPDANEHIRSAVSRAVDEKSSIELQSIDDMGLAISIINEVFKSKKVRCRVKTAKRASITKTAAGSGVAIVGASMAMEAAALAAPIVVGTVAMAGAALTGVGAVAFAGIAAHRLITSNPDYEVIKHPIDKKILLQYRK